MGDVVTQRDINAELEAAIADLEFREKEVEHYRNAIKALAKRTNTELSQFWLDYRNEVEEEFREFREGLNKFWKKIETAPRDGTVVLLYDGRPKRHVWSMVTGYWHDEKQMWEIISKHHPYGEPSHWAPLPPKPEKE